MHRTARARALLVVGALVGVLATAGCATVVIGRPTALEPSPVDVPEGEVRVVGAVDEPVDVLSRNALADLEQYWATTLPEVFGTEFQPLAGGYFSVDPGNVDPSAYPDGVGCGADPQEAENNAYYCQAPNAPNSDAITYDRAFLGELADDFGRFIPALVMAHEFGHAVQARVGSPGSSIATETQADCLAGTWTRWVADGNAEFSRLREPELDELLRGYLQLRDPVGTSTAAESAHGSYFDRVSAFQEGFDDGAEACRDQYGPGRVFTQGEFTSDEDLARGGDAPYGELWEIIEGSLPTVWNQAFEEVFGKTFTEPGIDRFSGDAPGCAAGPEQELVFCGADRVVGIDEGELAEPVYDEIGDFAVVTAVAIPYGLSVRDQLGLSTDDADAVGSAVCLSGWYAAKVYQGEANADISPGDVDESVRFLLTYGSDPAVLPTTELSGFQLVDLFRNGFLRGLESCGVDG
jgi:predicted metalloprotease